METKTCTKCKQEKAMDDFHVRKNRKKGRVSRCKECTRQHDKDRWSRGTKRASHRNWHLKITYGITLEDYNKMFRNQQGCCALCSKHQNEFEMKLSVDHDHKNGRVRGLLCNPCNIRLGQFENGNKWYGENKMKIDNYLSEAT